MTKTFAVLAVLALAGSAFAGFSIGYKPLDLPVGVTSSTVAYFDMMHLLRLGFAASSDFRIELLLGYDNVTFDDEVSSPAVSGNLSNFAVGGSAFYVIAHPSYTVFSIGGSLVYNSTSGEYNNVDIDGTTGLSIYPIMRIDFNIPGAERFALFTELGARYISAKTDTDAGDMSYSDFGTWGSENIIGGAYYSF
jgi:hypothetical protein